MGEVEIASYWAGELGASPGPSLQKVDQWVPGMLVAAMKEGPDPNATIRLAPVAARRLTGERAQEVSAKTEPIAPRVAEPSASMDSERREAGPGMERVGAFTVR